MSPQPAARRRDWEPNLRTVLTVMIANAVNTINFFIADISAIPSARLVDMSSQTTLHQRK
jgi:hypothetical protein